MLSIIEEKFLALLLELGEELVQKYRDLGLKASGQWEEELGVQVNGTKGIISGLDYTEYLTSNPRAPGKLPPVDPLIQWVKDKFGLSGEAAERAGWAIAQKIKKEGVEIHPEGTDLIDGVITDERVAKLHNDLGLFIVAEVAEEIQRDLQELAV